MQGGFLNMKFICETCGKTFGTQDECVAHEKEHQKAEVERREKEALERKSLENLNTLYKTYSDAVKKHNEEFGRKHAYYNPVGFLFDDPFKTWRVL
jgi:transposase